MYVIVIQLAIWLVIGCVMAIVTYKIAPRVGGNKYLWAFLTVLPLVNFIFLYYVDIGSSYTS